MSGYKEFTYKLFMGLIILGVAGKFFEAYVLVDSRTELSEEVRSEALAECENGRDTYACRENVETLHDGCYRWSLTRHDEYPEIDRDKYDHCLEHPPGKFRPPKN